MKTVEPTKQMKQVDDLFEEAKKDMDSETLKAAKVKIKEKLKLLAAAEKVVKNLEREIDDLKLQLYQDLS